MRVLYLTHRLPFAPNRGDRIRSFHLLEGLRAAADVSLVSLVHVEMLAAWIAVVIIGRELAVTGLRGVALSMGTVVPASSLGKAKTVSQYVAITVLILEKGVSPDVELFHLISRGVLWIAVALTVISGVDYFYRFFLHTNPKDLVKDRERWP